MHTHVAEAVGAVGLGVVPPAVEVHHGARLLADQPPRAGQRAANDRAGVCTARNRPTGRPRPQTGTIDDARAAAERSSTSAPTC
eukprot:COSAG01_NODE_11413_length_1940_cov_1.449756_3_plen_84_part_00